MNIDKNRDENKEPSASASGAESKGYHEWRRDDVIALVPGSAQTILSVGCAGGVTEAALNALGKKVVGIEMNPVAAQMAHSRGVEVIVGDAAEVATQLQGQTFDCLIYADVLEHMPSPEKVLCEHMAYLAPGGSVVISIPNFRNYAVARALFWGGEFRYEQAGIFDETHLRITTRKSVVRWVTDLNLRVVQIKYKIYRRPHRLLSALSFGFLKEFLATQVLVVATRP